MNIYLDYASWKAENKEFINKLVKTQSITIRRFSPVIAVVDYLFERVCNKEKLTQDEELFFSMGFDYIYDCFYKIKSILDFTFKSNYEEMEKCAKTINLLLYINDFQAEALELDKEPSEMAELDALEDVVNKFLEQHDNVLDEHFALLNKITDELFMYDEITTIDQIYSEIAISYGIYNDEEIDVYNEFLSSKINR
jgi:hypothetical protein